MASLDDKNKRNQQRSWANSLRSNIARKGRTLALGASLMAGGMGGGGQNPNMMPQENPATAASTETGNNQNEETKQQQSEEEKQKQTEEERQKEEQERAEDEERAKKEKSDITQGVNSIRYRKRLKEIKKEVREKRKEIKLLTKKLRTEQKKLTPLEMKKKLITIPLGFLKVIKSTLYTIAILFALTIVFLFVIPIAEPIFAAGVWVSRIESRLKKLLEPIKKAMKEIENEVERFKKAIAEVNKKIKELMNEAFELRNQSLLSSQKAA